MTRVHQTAGKSTGKTIKNWLVNQRKKQTTKKALQNSGEAIGAVKQSDVIKQNIMHQQIYVIELELNGQSLNKYCCVLCQSIFTLKDMEPHLKGIRHHKNVMKKAIDTSDIKSRLHKDVIHKPNKMVKFYFDQNLIACYCTACNYVHSNLDIFNKHYIKCKQRKRTKISNCEICRLEFNSNNDYNLHLKSNNHKSLVVLENMANQCVKIIKLASDENVKQEMKLFKQNESATKSPDVQKKRKIEQESIHPEIFEKLKKIKGVLRSKQSENVIDLNIVCFDKPTKSLFDKLYNTFANGSNLQKQNQLCIDSANDCFFVTNKENPQLKCCISFSLDFKQQVNDVVKVKVKNEPIDEDVVIIDSFNVPSKKQRLE